MRFTTTASGALSAFLLLSGQHQVEAHSWVEQLKRVAPNGSFVEPAGFSRNYVSRDGGGDPNQNNMKIVGPTAGQPLCNPITSGIVSTGYTRSTKFPKLKAARDDVVALRYLDNGHVTKWQNSPPKPKNQGTVYIYATTQPKDNEQFDNVHKKWTPDGQGGDKAGWLLATRNYDDGRCFEDGNAEANRRKQEFGIVNEATTDGQGMNHWCQNDIKLPDNVKPGQDLTLYWLWDYSTISVRQGAPDNEHLGEVKVVTPEFYISCMEVAIVDDCSDELGPLKGPKCGNNGAKGPATKDVNKPNAAAAAGVGSHAVAASGTFAFNFDKKQDLKLAAIPQQLTMDNYQVKVASAPAGGSGNGAQPSGTTPASSLPVKATAAPTRASSSTRAPRIKYVTVTEGLTTVWVTAAVKTETVYPTPAGGPNSAKITAAQQAVKTPAAASVRPRGQGWFGDAR